MIIRPRIIPTLLIHNGKLVKTKQFKNPKYLGDPINAIKIFNEKAVDELAILDITVSKSGGNINFELLEKMASEAFMPLSYGGGIKTIEDVKKIIALGFEKVIINSAFVSNERIIKEASEYLGSQSVVVSIDYKKGLFGSACYIKDGMQKTKLKPGELAKKAERAGAGEILLYSIDRDGMRTGYDIEMLKEISENVTIPVIGCGGADNIDSIRTALENGNADAVAAGSMFVYFGKREAVLISFPEEQELFDKGIYKIK